MALGLNELTQGSCKVSTLRPRQNGCHFADDIFLNENVWIPIKISLKFVPEGPINNIPALIQIMAWDCLGDKPLSEPMMVNLLTHICVTQSQKVKLTNLQTHTNDRYLKLSMWNYPHMNAIRHHWWLAKIGSGNGLMSLGNKPLPEPVLTKIFNTIWHH